MKVNANDVKKSFADKETVSQYANAVDEVGLWESEKKMIERFFQKENRVLDIGCGTGRTTFGLYELGYRNLIGADLSEHMIYAAKAAAQRKQIPIRFEVADAMQLSYEAATFDRALFSFNGMMQIPGRDNRLKALKEIRRVLKPNGVFLFTTHDRGDGEYASFWMEEKKRWELGEQDDRLIEFGDRLIEREGRSLYIHIPDRDEVVNLLQEAGFSLIEDRMRKDICEETEEVEAFAEPCRFWVVSK